MDEILEVTYKKPSLKYCDHCGTTGCEFCDAKLTGIKFTTSMLMEPSRLSSQDIKDLLKEFGW